MPKPPWYLLAGGQGTARRGAGRLPLPPFLPLSLGAGGVSPPVGLEGPCCPGAGRLVPPRRCGAVAESAGAPRGAGGGRSTEEPALAPAFCRGDATASLQSRCCPNFCLFSGKYALQGRFGEINALQSVNGQL